MNSCERLFGSWTNVNCESALTHQIPRILLRDPAPLNILHSTRVKPRTPKYKEASYIARARTPHPPTVKTDRHDAKRRPTRSHCSKETGRRLANWSELPKPWRGPIRAKPQSCTWIMISLSDMVNDSEDSWSCLLYTPVTELYQFNSLHLPLLTILVPHPTSLVPFQMVANQDQIKITVWDSYL